MINKIYTKVAATAVATLVFFISTLLVAAANPPQVTLVSPSNNEIVASTTVSFETSATDDIGLSGATLYYGKVAQSVMNYSEDGQFINETHDTFISADAPNSVNGFLSEINVDGQTPHAHALIKFPNIVGIEVGQINTGTPITEAYLEVECFDPGNTMTAYMLKEDWNEAEATWNERMAGVPWSNVGADGLLSHDSLGISLTCSSAGKKLLDISTFVEEWVDGTPNYGIILKDGGTDGVDFYSSENVTVSNRPVLKIHVKTLEDWGPKSTYSLNGVEDTATFFATLSDHATYEWNVEVEDIDGQKSFADQNGILVINTDFSPKTRVIFISIDGLRPDAITNLDQATLPNLYKFKNEGVTTDNARTDYDYTITLPNHSTMVTGRRVTQSEGHNWITNTDPSPGQTLHSNKGSYVAGIFDVIHDNGFSTALYASKTKFSLFDTSYNSVNGAVDTTGVDNGRDKITSYAHYSDTSAMTNAYITDMQSNMYTYSFLHYADPDTVGHANGWDISQGSSYSNSIKHVDAQLGKIFSMVENNPNLSQNTVIILTSDHGGSGTGHGDASLADDYTVPFYVWGKGVPSGVDLYQLNTATRQNPGSTRPDYEFSAQPVRNGDAGNLILSILGLPIIPGSGINTQQDLSIAPLGPQAPVAQAGNDQVVNDMDADDVEVVTLDATASSDIDGTIVSYEWTEGSSILGNESTISPLLSVGQHTITLTVVDNEGMSDTDTVVIDVVQDVSGPVVSDVTSSVTATSATITWVTDENADTLLRYGIGTTSADVSDVSNTTTHSVTINNLDPETTYVYEVVSKDVYGNLTVDNNNGQYYSFTTKSVAKVNITDISLVNSTQARGKNTFCTVTALVTAGIQNGGVASGTSISGQWSGAFSGSVNGVTDGNGQISFVTSAVKGCGTFTFTTTDVVLSGYLYDPLENTETSDSIITP